MRRRRFTKLRGKISGFSFDRVAKAFSSIFSRPLPLLLAVFTLAIYVSELKGNSSLINKLASKAKGTQLAGVCNYLNTHRNQTVGFSILATAFSASVPQTNLIFYFIAAATLSFALPTAAYLEYLSQAVFIILFFKLRDATSRLLISAASIAAYIGGYFLSHIG